MKVIWTDGYNRDEVADRLIADSVDQEDGDRIVKELRFLVKRDESQWYIVAPDDYKLKRGMEDLV